MPGFKATVTKTVWYWQKVRHTGQWKIIESPEINAHIYDQLIFDKGARERETNTTLSHLYVESKIVKVIMAEDRLVVFRDWRKKKMSRYQIRNTKF